MDYYTLHTAQTVVPCTEEEFKQAAKLLESPDEETEPERYAAWQDQDCEYHGFSVRYQGDCFSDQPNVFGIFLLSEESGTASQLPADFLAFIGKLIKQAGMPYLAGGWANTASKIHPASTGGGDWRIYPDGELVYGRVRFPPDTEIKWPEVA